MSKRVSFSGRVGDQSEGDKPCSANSDVNCVARVDGDGIDKSDVETKKRRFKDKHSLDSDEEYEDDKKDVMDREDIEGEESGTVDYDEGVQITPFNMEDELEEGHFDGSGMYIFDKKSEIRDNWMDNLNWVKVKELEHGYKYKHQKTNSDSDDSADEPSFTKEERLEKMKQMSKLMKPGENIIAALRRHGKTSGKYASASERLKAKKLGKKSDVESSKMDDKKDLLELTALADQMLNDGDTEIYQQTYEQLMYAIESKKPSSPVSDKLDTDKFETDMFSDESTPTTSAGKAMLDGDGEEKSRGQSKENNAVSWVYKETGDGEDLGPFSCSQMLTWQGDGKFGSDGMMARRVGTQKYYNTKRIDFELYVD